MAIPFTKDTKTKRKEQVRNILGPEQFQKKGKLYVLGQFITEHFKVILTVAVVLACVFTHIYYFNRLTTMEQQVTNLRSQIESGLQMRQNIVPALTLVVHQFINHERDVFLSAVEAREKSLNGSKETGRLVQGLKGLTGEDISSSALARFMAIAENYPQLVSSQSYQLLISQIADVENQIYKKRIEYNDAVNVYNTRLSTFPANIVGRVLRFRVQPYFSWEKEPEWVFEANPRSPEPPLRMKSEKPSPEK